MKLAHRILTMRSLLMALALTLALCCVAFTACAADDPVEAFIEINPDTLTAPGSVNVSIRVSNTSENDLPDPVTLYGPAGTVVPSFGDGGSVLLTAGKSVPWQGALTVTQEMLDKGVIEYTLKYLLDDGEGNLAECTKVVSAPIKFTGQSVELTVTRTLTPQVVRNGKDAGVVYELYNSGNVKLSNIKVKENISRTAQTVDALAAGEKKTLTFTAKMGSSSLKSSATITYKVEGDSKTHTKKEDEITIPLASPNLKMTLEAASTGVSIGEPAKLLLTFVNEGNIDYSNVTVTDQNKGEIFTNLSIPAGQTVVKEKEFSLLEPAKFKFTATLHDNTGSTNTMSTGEVSVGVYDPEKSLLLTLNLTCDKDVIYEMPANARMTLIVTNNSDVRAEDIAIKHGATAITTLDTLDAGASYTVTRDFLLSQAGKFQFTASTKDGLGNTVEFTSNVLQINYTRPTAEPTVVPTVEIPVLVTLPPPTAGDVDPLVKRGGDALLILSVVVGVVFVGMLALIVVSGIIRAKNRKLSEDAYDHLDLAERRVYTEPADDELPDKPVNVEDEQAAAAEDDSAVEDIKPVADDSFMPHERILREEETKRAEINEKVQSILNEEGEAPAQTDVEGDDMTRRRRRSARTKKTEDD